MMSTKRSHIGVIIKRYKNEKAFQKDARKLAKKGWAVQTVTSEQPRAGCARWLTIGLFAVIFKPKPELVVTYNLTTGAG